MPSIVNRDYVPPNYRPNYRQPTRTTPQQQRNNYDYIAEQRELRRYEQERQAQIAAINRRQQELVQRRTQQSNYWGMSYLPNYVRYNALANRVTATLPPRVIARNPTAPVTAPTPHRQFMSPAMQAYYGRTTFNTPNLPESMRDLVASGIISPSGYDPYEIGGAAYGSVGNTWNNIVNRRAKDKAEWDAIFNMPRETLAELIARGAVDPWGFDPYEIGGSPYPQSAYDEEYPEDTGYGGWGGGWGGGGGSYSSAPSIGGESARQGQWYTSMIDWNI